VTSIFRLILARIYLQTGHRRRPSSNSANCAAGPGQQAHRYRLAQFYLAQDNLDESTRHAAEAVQAKPDEVEPKLALVDVLAARRSVEEAEKQLAAM